MYDFMLVLFSWLFLIAGFLLPILRSFQSRCDRYKPIFDFNEISFSLSLIFSYVLLNPMVF